MHRNNILNIYPTRCNVTQFILSGNCSSCFGWYHHPSSGAQTTVCTASGICHTVIAICRYRGRVGTGLSVLLVAYATHSTLKPEHAEDHTFCRKIRFAVTVYRGKKDAKPYSNIYSTRCNVTQFILSGNCTTCFGWYHHPSSGTQTTGSTASGICHTVTAICRYRGRVGTGLSVLWVAYATHSTLISTLG